MLWLTEKDVVELVSMDAAIDVMEGAFRQLAAGKVINNTRQRVTFGGPILNLMSAGLEEAGVMGFKAYALGAESPKFLVWLYDTSSGNLLAIIEGDYLGQIRTGAATGVATKYMACKQARVAAQIGTGRHAAAQAQAVCAARPIRLVKVYGRSPQRTVEFCEYLRRECEVPAKPVLTLEAALEDADIVTTVTSTVEPILYGDLVRNGVHINAVGSVWGNRREVDSDVVARARVVAVDSLESCREQGGDLAIPFAEGRLSWEDATELGDIVTGKVQGRSADDDVTLFKSVGLAMEDVAVALHLYEEGRARGYGRELPLS